MFKFKKRTEKVNERFDIDFLISNNPVLYCKDNLLYSGGVFEIVYNKDSNEYETWLTLPAYDENGEAVKIDNNKPIAHFHFSPLYCILAENIYTKEDYERVSIKQTKVEELRGLLKRIEEI